MELERDNEHFEGVLGRLDSLVRRGQPETPPPPPPPVSEATIPVLTEVYAARPETVQTELPVTDILIEQAIPDVSAAEKLEQALAAVLPMMATVLEEALVMKVQPAMESALKQVLDDLHPQIELILRQRLQTLLAQDSENQMDT